MTTLRRAFKGNDDFETMKRIVSGDVMLPSAAVPGYPRELEAIVLTAMANDPNARFQTAQEMIEALDAFAQRAKLVGSNTAMGRFMVQLFGSKKEPWVEGSAPHGERTEITDEHAADESDDEKTTLIEEDQRDELRAAPRPLGQPDTSRAPTSPISSRRTGGEAAWNDAMPTQRQTPTPTPMPPPPAAVGPAPVPVSGKHQIKATLAGNPPPRTYSQPPVAMPANRLGSEHSQPGAPVMPPQLAASGPRPKVASHPPHASVREQSLSDVKLRNYRSWVLVLVLILAGIAAGVAIAMNADM
jgi:hypothetical protein